MAETLPPHEHWTFDPPRPWWKRPRTWLIAGAVALVIGVAALIAAAVSGNDPASGPTRTAAPRVATTSDNDPATRSGRLKAASRRAHPFRGVVLSGSAGTVHLVAFRARTITENFSPIVRVHNDDQEAALGLAVKVTVLDGGDPIATANGVIERLEPGQTVTVEPLSSDEWTERDRYTYDVQIDED
jgi:hypothetical protein